MPNILERENDKMNDKKETTPTATKCIRDNDGHRWRKQTTPWATPRSKGGSNDMNTTPPNFFLCSTSK